MIGFGLLLALLGAGVLLLPQLEKIPGISVPDGKLKTRSRAIGIAIAASGFILFVLGLIQAS